MIKYIQPIQTYHKAVKEIYRREPQPTEGTLRPKFENLLNDCAKEKGLVIISEVSDYVKYNKSIRLDGVFRDSHGLDKGYWESKAPKTNLDAEIEKKLRAGYPTNNILFENSEKAILIQNGKEVDRCFTTNDKGLSDLLEAFIAHVSTEDLKLQGALEKFSKEIPQLAKTFQKELNTAQKENEVYQQRVASFLSLCQENINPNMESADVREMVIQHILTEELFRAVLGDFDFHKENNIAKELEDLVSSLFTESSRQDRLKNIRPYYEVIRYNAAQTINPRQKQDFLKELYEKFYNAYNPKAADRLGVVYTPHELVQYMIHQADALLQKHFGRRLQDPGVDIMDPATGTGTFICDLLQHIHKDRLEDKYKNEIHANEVSILAYYIANINIEYIYKQQTGRYLTFPNICFVDTLDNLNFGHKGKQTSFQISEINTKRINAQNERSISVIIGNPPYNSNQRNENDDNKNREYPEIDKQIKNTYIKESKAQKTKLYDMYVRFYRWASMRLQGDGMIAFVTNRSFMDAYAFDGFRKRIVDEFDEAYILDLGGEMRTKYGKKGEAVGNVFSIQVGVAIMFLIQKKHETSKDKKPCRIHYHAIADSMKKEEKLGWLKSHADKKMPFREIMPDKENNWLHQSTSDFKDQIPLVKKEAKLNIGKAIKAEGTLFQMYFNGAKTNRDDWVFDRDTENLQAKMEYSIREIRRIKASFDDENPVYPTSIKWSRDLKVKFHRKQLIENFDPSRVVPCYYHPFTTRQYYASKYWSDVLTDYHKYAFGQAFNENAPCICFSYMNQGISFHVLASQRIPNYDFLWHTQCVPMHYYDKDGKQQANVTDWGLARFRAHYGDKAITGEGIFAYVYAVLHNPDYRERYANDLRRSFPHIPLYADFEQWRAWGARLMALHMGFEDAEPYPLAVEEHVEEHVEEGMEDFAPKALLKAVPELGEIRIDEHTTLKGIPSEAWDYKLGNRSALAWVLNQYAEKKPRDAVIAERFHVYRFADYKEEAIALLKRVCRVSVETMRVLRDMKDG